MMNILMIRLLTMQLLVAIMITFNSVVTTMSMATTSMSQNQNNFHHTNNDLLLLSPNITTIYIIGDLHSDLFCAKEWISETHLINLHTFPYEWIGPSTEAIVFIGDYFDRGPYTIQLLHFIRDLQKSFPNNVVAFMGNHDWSVIQETLFSTRNSERWTKGWNPSHDQTKSFLHPEAYLHSGFSPPRHDDREILLSFYDALFCVYNGACPKHTKVCVSPLSKCGGGPTNSIFKRAPIYANNQTLVDQTMERIKSWRYEFAKGLVQSGLMHWLSNLPVVGIIGDALFVHAGISIQTMNRFVYFAKAENIPIVNAIHALTNVPLNKYFHKHDHYHDHDHDQHAANTANNQTRIQKQELPQNEQEPNTIHETMSDFFGTTLQTIDELTNYRKYFKGGNGCHEIKMILNLFQQEYQQYSTSIQRIIVGHTPHLDVTSWCNDTLLNADSTLSRYYRKAANYYCPLDKSIRRELKLRNVHFKVCDRIHNLLEDYDDTENNHDHDTGTSTNSINNKSSSTINLLNIDNNETVGDGLGKCKGSILILQRESALHDWPTEPLVLYSD